MRALLSVTAILCITGVSLAQESLGLEAEHLDDMRGYCWPMGKPEMKQIAGHWAVRIVELE